MNHKHPQLNNTFSKYLLLICLLALITRAAPISTSYLTRNYNSDKVGQSPIQSANFDEFQQSTGERLLSIVLLSGNSSSTNSTDSPINTTSNSSNTTSSPSSQTMTPSVISANTMTNSSSTQNNTNNGSTTSNVTYTEVLNPHQTPSTQNSTSNTTTNTSNTSNNTSNSSSTTNSSSTPTSADTSNSSTSNSSTNPQRSTTNSSSTPTSTDTSNSSTSVSSTSQQSTTNSTKVTNNSSSTITSQKFPTELDYSNQGYLSSDDKKLGYCNSSWAISAAFMYESKLISLRIKTTISEQSIISCSSYYAPNNRMSSCSGGNFEDALNFLAKVGAVRKSGYPKTSLNLVALSHRAPICTDKNRIFIGEGKVVIIKNATNDQIKQLLDIHGPIIADINADSNLKNYQKETFNSCPSNSSIQTNLTVVIFGYKGNDYWLIRAPFGQQWGFMGSMKLSMTNNCGLTSRLGYIDYNYTSINNDVNQVFDPTAKYNQKYQSTSTLFQRYLVYMSTCLLLLFLML